MCVATLRMLNTLKTFFFASRRRSRLANAGCDSRLERKHSWLVGWFNQPTNPSTKQTVKQPTHQTTQQPIHQSINSTNHPLKQSTKQSTQQSINQANDHSTKQASKQSTNT